MINEWDVKGRLAIAIENYKNKNNFTDPISFIKELTNIESPLKIKYTDIINTDGQYIDSDTTILINSSITYLQRQNFTLYHEFTHYLIYQVDEFQDIFEFLNEKIGEKKNITKSIEDLCNFGASEFLIEKEIKNLIVSAQIEDLEVLKNIVKTNSTVSIPALAYKLAEIKKSPMTVVIIHNGINTRKTNGRYKYPYIEYSFNTESFKYPCWGNLSQTHLLKRAVVEDIELRWDESTFPFTSATTMPCYIVGFRHTPDRYLACLYKDKSVLIDNSQISLF